MSTALLLGGDPQLIFSTCTATRKPVPAHPPPSTAAKQQPCCCWHTSLTRDPTQPIASYNHSLRTLSLPQPLELTLGLECALTACQHDTCARSEVRSRSKPRPDNPNPPTPAGRHTAASRVESIALVLHHLPLRQSPCLGCRRSTLLDFPIKN